MCGIKRRAAYLNAGMEKQLEVFNVLLNGCCQEQFNKASVIQTVLNVGSTQEKFIISFPGMFCNIPNNDALSKCPGVIKHTENLTPEQLL